MKNLNFFTTAIPFSSEVDLQSFVDFYSNFQVHPTNFRNSDGSFIQDAWKNEPLDCNRIIGNTLNMIINEDDCSVVILGEGGLDFCRINNLGHNYYETSEVLGNFLETIFNYEFAQINPDVEIYIESTDLETGVKEIETIRMSDYYSPQAYKKRYDEKLNEYQRNQRHILDLQAKEQQLLKELEALQLLTLPDPDGLPF